MAQVVKLKRTAVAGKIPTTSHLELGELAMNTFDGRIFLKKDSGTPIITEILTTNTEGGITGSLNLNGDITANNLTLSGNATIDGNITLGGNITIGDNVADVVTVTAGFSGSLIPDTTSLYDLGSTTKKWNKLHVVTASADYFVGNGSGLTNVTAEVSEQNSITASFSNQDQIQVTHNFDSRNIHVSVYDSSHQLIIPESVTLTTTNTVDIDLSAPGNGYVVVAKGGHLLDGVYVDNVTKVSDTFTNETSYIVTHSFDTKDVIVTVYNTNDEQLIPQLISTPTTSSVELGFENPTSGRVVVVKGGHLVSGSIPFENISNKPDLISGSVAGSNVVGSDTVTSIETITSAAYAQITPVTGTLYIITD
jgi:hypothetical protein